ncbi:MAG TPA: DUF523 and DUF1722 domain-containing protein [Methanomassiliicoccales archaeon]|nr:DUF523 and DUF1722 domain-containing protein [Methanomassiliicoccales archaeon]
MDERTFARPRLVISKCIEFDRCRYNGEMIPSEFVKRLMTYVDFIPVCMEVEIGLGVPRDPIRVIQLEDGLHLFQPSSGKDFTVPAKQFSAQFLAGQEDVDGFLLKSRSPSCGVKNVKVYPMGEKVASLTAKGTGFFGQEVIAKFSDLAIEDEDRLRNLRIGEHFLTRIFALAEARALRDDPSVRSLIDFHARNKLLLMYYSQKELAAMGNIVANRKGAAIDAMVEEYVHHLRSALVRPPRCGSGTNVMLHAFGYVSDHLNSEEKALFLDALHRYREGKLPMTVATGMVRSWIARFNVPYLRQQTFLQPFPAEFLELMSNDACIGRDLWSQVGE